jgi:hypothetical protein
MTTLPDPEPLPEAFENPDESNVELAKAAASDLLSGKESTVYLGDGNCIGAKDSSKLSEEL